MFKNIHVFRIQPGVDIVEGIEHFCTSREITSGIIIGIIGSVNSATLNYLKQLPGKYESHRYEGPLEIVCAQGSVALKNGERILHIHIQLASDKGCSGGHLVEAEVFSTAEVMIGELDFQLSRYLDKYTGLNELEG
ncbi:MAG: DNA-binding protein [Dehalococcoidia bacterium]